MPSRDSYLSMFQNDAYDGNDSIDRQRVLNQVKAVMAKVEGILSPHASL